MGYINSKNKSLLSFATFQICFYYELISFFIIYCVSKLSLVKVTCYFFHFCQISLSVNTKCSDTRKVAIFNSRNYPIVKNNAVIDQIYDCVVFDYGIIPGIENCYLSRIRAFRVDTKTDLTKVKKVAGDFNQGELGDAVNNEERNKLIVKAYLERCKGQQALIFAVDVAHTISLTNEFTKNGIIASYVTGDKKLTPKEKRHQILKDFSNKKIQVLVNCAVLTEGFDEPN